MGRILNQHTYIK